MLLAAIVYVWQKSTSNAIIESLNGTNLSTEKTYRNTEYTKTHAHTPASQPASCGSHMNAHLNREPLNEIEGTISTSHVFLIDCGVLRFSCNT